MQTCYTTKSPKDSLKLIQIPFLCNVFSRLELYIANAYDLLAFAASQKSGKRSIGAILKWVSKPFIKLYNAIRNAWSKVSPVTKVGSAIGTAGYGKQKQLRI